MSFIFSATDINTIARILGAPATEMDTDTMFRLSNEKTRQSLTLTISNDVALGTERTGALVVAQTQHGYFELHGCTGYVPFEPDEIIFIGTEQTLSGTRITGMVLGKECTCSMFVNISRENLTADFTELDPRILMAAMQLSLTEEMLSA
jgi:hypothetical protein